MFDESAYIHCLVDAADGYPVVIVIMVINPRTISMRSMAMSFSEEMIISIFSRVLHREGVGRARRRAPQGFNRNKITFIFKTLFYNVIDSCYSFPCF